MEAIFFTFAALTLCAAESVAAEPYIAPWSKPYVSDHRVSCWGRTYDFQSSLLPARIVTQGDNILAGPIELLAVIGGKSVPWHDVSFKLIETGTECVRYLTRANRDSLSVECQMATEFDGATRVDILIKPRGTVDVDSLDLVIPFKPRYAKLFHHSSTYPIYVWDWPKRRINAGSIGPDGLRLPFVFHIWLGDDDRGLQVFSESDESWCPSDPENAVIVTPQNGSTMLRMNLLANTKLTKPWKWTFGFIATPVKPWPDDYYDLHYCQMGDYPMLERSDGGVPADAEHPPFIDIMRNLGVNYVGWHEAWSDEQSLPRPKYPEKFVTVVKACHDRGMAVATYTGCYMSVRSKEYNKDWDVYPVGDYYQHQRPDNGDICRITCNNTGYPEFLLGQYSEAVRKYGIDGLYLDGISGPLPCTNTKHGCGYVGKDGNVHPTMPIWRTRDLMKGLYRLVKQNKRGIIVSHTSSSILLPALSFADLYIDGEHLLGHLKLGTPEYPEDLLRAEMSGHNFGIPATQLPIRDSDVEVSERARTLSLLYDALWMWNPYHQADIWRAYDSFGAAGSKWIPYWKTGILISYGDLPDLKISAYLYEKRGALFVVANLGGEAATAKLTIKRKGVGLAPEVPLRAYDASSKDEIAMSGDEMTITVQPNRFRLVAVEVVK
ncbi:MAG: DUF6067 family protein [Armatimonadetes bacterium]|nr:DUF6067 family protein [Armatimonadota bacterium]